MGGFNPNRTVEHEILLASELITASGPGSTIQRASDTARTLEIRINITIVDTGDFDFFVESSLDGTLFTEIPSKRLAAVVTTGEKFIVLNRADNAIGRFVRLNWVKNSGTSMTFKADLLRLE